MLEGESRAIRYEDRVLKDIAFVEMAIKINEYVESKRVGRLSRLDDCYIYQSDGRC